MNYWQASIERGKENKKSIKVEREKILKTRKEKFFRESVIKLKIPCLRARHKWKISSACAEEKARASERNGGGKSSFHSSTMHAHYSWWRSKTHTQFHFGIIYFLPQSPVEINGIFYFIIAIQSGGKERVVAC